MGFHNLCWGYKPAPTKKKISKKTKIGSRDEHAQLIQLHWKQAGEDQWDEQITAHIKLQASVAI